MRSSLRGRIPSLDEALRPAGSSPARPARPCSGYLKAVWLEIFGPIFIGFSAEIDPRDPSRSPGPAPHINVHEKSTPQTKSRAKWRRPNCLQIHRQPTAGARHQSAPKLPVTWLHSFWVPECSLAGNFPPRFSKGSRPKSTPRDPPRSPGPAPHINLHEKPAPQTNSNAIFLPDWDDAPSMDT